MRIPCAIALSALLGLASGSACALSLDDAAAAAAMLGGNAGGTAAPSGNADTSPATGTGTDASAGAVGNPLLGALVSPQTAELLGALRALDVTPQQALGGTAALLGLAQSRLPGADYAQLTQAVPGVEKLAGGGALGQLGALGALGGLLGQPAAPTADEAGSQSASGTAPAATGALPGSVSSMQDVDQAFAALGMSPGMAGQFAPILLQLLGSQGVGGPLLQSLAGIWGVGGNAG